MRWPKFRSVYFLIFNVTKLQSGIKRFVL